MPIDPRWNIYKIIDPHDKKPPFCIWIAVTPLNRHYVIAEYPVEPWDQVQGTILTIGDFVKEFERIENGKHENFQYIRQRLNITECLGDPNKFSDRQPNTGKTMKEEYEWSGCQDIFTKINDDIAYGHSKVRELLQYDPMRKVDSLNAPQLYVFKSCKNVSRAFKGYQYKSNQGLSAGLSDKIEKTWECPMACVRYHAVHYEGYQDPSMIGFDAQQDLEEQAVYGANIRDMHERFI
jgi:hypothetical protein